MNKFFKDSDGDYLNIDTIVYTQGNNLYINVPNDRSTNGLVGLTISSNDMIELNKLLEEIKLKEISND